MNTDSDGKLKKKALKDGLKYRITDNYKLKYA